MNAADLEARLTTRWLGRPVLVLDETGSTNDDVLARARAGAPAGLVVVAAAQTRGRGRLGRAWHSPPQGNLYLSALLRLDPLPPITLAAGLALQQTLNDLGCRASIKWPNDLLVDGKKVAGILTETSTRGNRMDAIALGIGLNVNGEPPSELAERATSLRLALHRSFDLADVAARLCAELEVWIDRAVAGGAPVVVDAFRRDSGMIGRRVEVTAHGQPRVGIARDLAADGALLVEDADGLMFRVVSGEVEQLP